MMFGIEDFGGASAPSAKQDLLTRCDQVCDAACALMETDDLAEVAWLALTQEQRSTFVAHIVAAARLLEKGSTLAAGKTTKP